MTIATIESAEEMTGVRKAAIGPKIRMTMASTRKV